MEVLRLSNKDLEEENKRMKQRVTRGGNNLVNVTHQLLTMQQRLEDAPSQPKKATRGATIKKQGKIGARKRHMEEKLPNTSRATKSQPI